MPARKLTADNRGERVLKAARVSLGLTQSALAKRLKVSQTTVSHWEKNIGIISLNDLVFYCKMLNLDASRIIEIKNQG